MRPETAIVEIHSQYKVHTEFYRNPDARETIRRFGNHSKVRLAVDQAR